MLLLVGIADREKRTGGSLGWRKGGLMFSSSCGGFRWVCKVCGLCRNSRRFLSRGDANWTKILVWWSVTGLFLRKEVANYHQPQLPAVSFVAS